VELTNSSQQSSLATVLDPRNDEFRSDPFPVFSRLRREDPVHWSDSVGGWVLTRYADVVATQRDPRLSSDRITPFFDGLQPEQRPAMQQLGTSLRSWAVFSDPPQHTRLRKLFNKAITARAIEGLGAGIERMVHDLFAPALRRGHIDLIGEFAYPLPALVICEMIGLPLSDIDNIKVWSGAIEPFLGLATKPQQVYDDARHNVAEMTDHFRTIVDGHRERPRQDILSGLIAASDGGDHLTEDELIATCMMLVFAAHTTTTHLIGNGMIALLRHPEALTKLTADPSQEAVNRAVEEMLRYDGPVQVARRVVREPIEIGGRRLSGGDLVFPMLNAANRDPEQFAEPDRFDITRSENRHIAFGFGAHFCPGAPLARMEAQIAFTQILRAVGEIRLAGPVEWIESFGFRGAKALQLEFRVR
jgi:cytochrome P450